jgi:GTPase SAR1 family protein
MGSGKSTIIREYLIENQTEEFTPPPVEAKFRGMDFQFIDDIFALRRDDNYVNFYELDAPTINKWTQFVKVADAIIIVYNYTKSDYFEDPTQFITSIAQHATTGIPLFFVVNNCDTEELAREKLEQQFKISELNSKHKIHITPIPTGEMYFSERHGKRIRINMKIVENMYQTVLDQLLQ